MLLRKLKFTPPLILYKISGGTLLEKIDRLLLSGVDLMDEKDLIRKAKKGDTLALSKLLQQNYSFLFKYLMKATLHPQIAEDLTQETMMKCIEKIQLYNGESKFSSWLITIGTNLLSINSVERSGRKTG